MTLASTSPIRKRRLAEAKDLVRGDTGESGGTGIGAQATPGS